MNLGCWLFTGGVQVPARPSPHTATVGRARGGGFVEALRASCSAPLLPLNPPLPPQSACCRRLLSRWRSTPSARLRWPRWLTPGGGDQLLIPTPLLTRSPPPKIWSIPLRTPLPALMHMPCAVQCLAPQQPRGRDKGAHPSTTFTLSSLQRAEGAWHPCQGQNDCLA